MIHYRAVLKVSVVSIAVALLVSCAYVQSPEPVTQALDKLMTALHERGYFNGAIVVGRGDEILYDKGFGFANVAEEIPFTPDTPAYGAPWPRH